MVDRNRIVELDRLTGDPSIPPSIRKDLFQEGANLWEALKKEEWGSLSVEEWWKPARNWRGMPHKEMVADLQKRRGPWLGFIRGLQQARSKWGWNPVECFAKAIEKSSASNVSDFGCGDAELSRMLEGKATVRSFDLQKWNDSVEVCDIAATPLESNSQEAVVLSCALWGNASAILTETYRVLKVGGIVYLAEPVSLRSEEEITELLSEAGFAVERIEIDPEERFFFCRSWKVDSW